MHKKRTLLILGLGVIIGLSSCGGGGETNPPEDNPPSEQTQDSYKISLSSFEEILMNEANNFEVEESNSSTSINTTNKDHKTDVLEERGVFLKDNVSFYEGTNKTTFKNDNSTREDRYTKVAQAKTYDMQKVFYLVTDYEKEELEIYHDSAKRLPVYQDGDPNEDGVDYLLESSLPNQLCRQVSLYVAAFIRTNLTNNMSLNGYKLPDVNVEKEGSNYVYTFEPYGYSYSEDGIDVHVSSEFSAVLTEDLHLLEAKTVYETIESAGEDSYTVTDINEYSLTYGERKTLEQFNAEGGKIINPEDYFLSEVNSVEPYYFDNGTKVSLEPTKLPVGKYVRFEAKDFLPAKSVDKEMKVISLVENPDSAFEIEGGVLYVKKMGKGKVKIESQTGIATEIAIETVKPAIQSITISDYFAGFARLENGMLKAYAGDTYKGIRVLASPDGVDLSDIQVEISDPELLELELVESKGSAKYLEYNYHFKPGSEGKDITVTFSSKENPSVSVIKTYRVVKKMSIDDLKVKLMNNSYKWTNIMNIEGPIDFVLTFQDETHGTYQFFGVDGSLESSCEFTYEISSDYKFSMTPIKGDFMYEFDYKDSFVDKEGEFISLSDPKYSRDQVFEIEVK